MLDDEFAQLRTNATLFPLFFLFVAAFLLNVVLSRLVASQRDEIAALKAFGYSDREVGAHYLGVRRRGGGTRGRSGLAAGHVDGGEVHRALRHLLSDFPRSRRSSTGAPRRSAIAVSGGLLCSAR